MLLVQAMEMKKKKDEYEQSDLDQLLTQRTGKKKTITVFTFITVKR